MFYVKRILAVLAILLLVFAAINWQYFKVQIGYYLDPPNSEEVRNPDGSQIELAEPNRLWIRSLGVDAPIVYTDATDEDGFQRALQDGVVHYPDTAMPGEKGNAYYFGHSSDFPTAPGNYKTIFALLPQIEIGATIEITDMTGKIYRYRVDNKRPVESDDLSVLDQDESKKQLSLQTSYPVGTALRRYVVVAYLIE